MPFELSKHGDWQDAVAAYTNKSCQVLSADVSILAQARQQLGERAEHIILPEIARKQLVGPAVRQGDEEWFSVVRWTIYALIAAEELGITRANVDAMKASGNAEVRRFLGVDMDLGRQLGLSADWTQRVIKAGRQLRRAVRAPPGAQVAAEARAAAQQPRQPRRPALRAGFPLTRVTWRRGR